MTHEGKRPRPKVDDDIIDLSPDEYTVTTGTTSEPVSSDTSGTSSSSENPNRPRPVGVDHEDENLNHIPERRRRGFQLGGCTPKGCFTGVGGLILFGLTAQQVWVRWLVPAPEIRYSDPTKSENPTVTGSAFARTASTIYAMNPDGELPGIYENSSGDPVPVMQESRMDIIDMLDINKTTPEVPRLIIPAAADSELRTQIIVLEELNNNYSGFRNRMVEYCSQRYPKESCDAFVDQMDEWRRTHDPITDKRGADLRKALADRWLEDMANMPEHQDEFSQERIKLLKDYMLRQGLTAYDSDEDQNNSGRVYLSVGTRRIL